MRLGRRQIAEGTTEEAQLVSGRFLSDFFRVLEGQGIPASELLGDLPIPIGEGGRVRSSVDWNLFAELMKRLENRLGGPTGLEACGALIGEMAPAAALRGLSGIAASPFALYYAASQWALRRALPGVRATLTREGDGQLTIVASLAEGLRPCPQIFHFAAGGARVLPRVIGLDDAVVSASIRDRDAHYRITAPPSRSLVARVRRLFRAIFSAGSILHFLEAQQLELHAKNDALQRAHDALAASERRYRAITDAAVDVLCEIDAQGRVVYVSASVHDLIGYTPEQVTNSHYRLWVAREDHASVERAFDRLLALPESRSLQETVRLHSDRGHPIEVELTARCYLAPEGGRRIVCILRDMSDRVQPRAEPRRPRPQVAEAHEALRTHVVRNPADAHPTPVLERSLAQLLARLDERSSRARAASPTALANATNRMTRVVDASLAQADGGSSDFQWIELQKLLRRVQDTFRTLRGPDPTPALHVDLSRAPSEIWSREVLLETALLSLLDWAVEQSGDGSEGGPDRAITLRAEAPSDPTHANRLLLSVHAPSVPKAADGSVTSETSETSDPSATPARDAAIGQLALAIATDAAETLGGRIIQSEDTSGPCQRIQLAQPPDPGLGD